MFKTTKSNKQTINKKYTSIQGLDWRGGLRIASQEIRHGFYAMRCDVKTRTLERVHDLRAPSAGFTVYFKTLGLFFKINNEK